jgi:penicillin amidase
MRVSRRALRVLMGKRMPPLEGTVTASGLREELVIRRDRWGVPHIEARSEADAWCGLGFAQGQDRAFQLEGLVRVVRGTLAELVGSDGLAVDRLSRRIGFRRAAERQLLVLDADVRQAVEAFVAGVNAGIASLPRRPHELALLRCRSSRWEAADVLGFAKLFALLLPANWDSELARLLILRADGPEALRALHATYDGRLPVSAPPGVAAGPAVDRLADELTRFLAVTGAGGGSNNWVVAPSRTKTGRPLLANDPHLSPSVPPHFYLADLRCPQWHAVGASLVGAFGIFAGHNDHAAWGTTAGLVDNTDLCIEELGPDGRSVRRGNDFVPCEVRTEQITVRGGDDVVETVLVTPEGPIVGPALDGDVGAVSMRATWLERRPLRGVLELVRLQTPQDFHTRLADFPSISQNVVFATVDGHIGWQLVGEAPNRRSGHGVLPMWGADLDAGWGDVVPFSDMPRALDPDSGWIATANNQPVPDGEGPFLSVDFVDGYRVARIGEVLAAREDWDVAGLAELQLDLESVPWRQMRDVVLASPVGTDEARLAAELLRDWDGRVSADSAAATVFELFIAELIGRIARAKAPNSADWVLGRGFTPLIADNLLPARHVSHVVRLLREQPPGWLDAPWPTIVAESLDTVARQLLATRGPDPAHWRWGQFRPYRIPHPAGRGRLLGAVFNLGPLPGSGDGTTVCQAAVDLNDPAQNTYFTPVLRMVVDVGQWQDSRWSLPGGQSGNPVSAHYDDQMPAFMSAKGIAIAWTEQEVAEATVHTLTLAPRGPEAGNAHRAEPGSPRP